METKTTNTLLLTVRKDFVENKKNVILGVAAIWVTYMLVGVLLGYNSSGRGSGQVVMLGILSVIFACMGASFAFGGMKSKQGRISTLMSPATAFDKFLSKWLGVVPCLFLVLSVGWLLTDVARIITYWLTTKADNIIPSYMQFTDYIGKINNAFSDSRALIFLFGNYLFNQAIFLFGAILWPKLSFFKTLLALWGLQMIFGIVMAAIVSHLTPEFYLMLDSDWVFYLVIGVLIALTLGLYYLTYLRFKNSQVTYRLF